MPLHRVTAEGLSYELEAPEGDWISDQLAAGVPYEHLFLRWVAAFMPPGRRIVDVGANIGNHSIYWALRGAQVDAFEANPVTVDLLRRNIERAGAQVKVHPVGLGASNTQAALVEGRPGNLSGQRLAVGAGGIEVRALDESGIDPDFVKIDVEGMEPAVLQGARETLRRCRPVLMIEANDPVAVRDTLRPLGYRRFPISASGTTFLYLPDLRTALRVARTCGPVVMARGRRIPHRLRRRFTRS